MQDAAPMDRVITGDKVMLNEQSRQYFTSLFNSILVMQELEPLNVVEGDNTLKIKGDEVDHATREREQQLENKLKGRQSIFLKKIENGLIKLENGSFGVCEDCDGGISLTRLKARPTATLCIECKEEQESGEKHIPYEKKSHTHGKSLGSDSNVIHIQFGEDGNNGKQMPTRKYGESQHVGRSLN